MCKYKCMSHRERFSQQKWYKGEKVKVGWWNLQSCPSIYRSQVTKKKSKHAFFNFFFILLPPHRGWNIFQVRNKNENDEKIAKKNEDILLKFPKQRLTISLSCLISEFLNPLLHGVPYVTHERWVVFLV